MKIALCQTAMHWTMAENLENIGKQLALCASNDVALAVFPECAVTGYHRQMPAITTQGTLDAAFEKLHAFAREYQTVFIVGSPYIKPDEPDSVLNSALFFQPGSDTFGVTSKVGLAEKEPLYFTAGRERKIFHWGDKRIGMVFCIEMNHTESLIADFEHAGLDVLFWISYIAWGDPTEGESKIIQDNSLAVSLALGIPVINVNWANAVNSADIKDMGGSRLIVNGEITLLLAADREMMEIVDLQ
ncbi:MAG: carbon-nitrogen hydrolase family protein [Saprospiraceae bacterium]|nr:carbon-nitrogen hydrolase family protein [Lewinella sp.]